MKTIGWIAIFIGIVNLICGKLLPGISFGIVGALIVLFNGIKNNTQIMPKTINKINNGNKDDQFLSLAMDIKIVEKVIGTDFSKWEQRDIIETVESFKRWAFNQGCQISDVQNQFLKSYKKVFANDNIEDILPYIKKKEKEEAERFNIRERNTCAHYMNRWLNSLLLLEQTKQKTQEKTVEQDKTKIKMKVRNRKTAEELVISENAPLRFINNPNTNKIFFECGKIRGYVSPAVSAKVNDVELEDLQYAECAKPDTEDWIPCLLFKSDSYLLNGVRTVGKEVLNAPKIIPEANDDLPF